MKTIAFLSLLLLALTTCARPAPNRNPADPWMWQPFACYWASDGVVAVVRNQPGIGNFKFGDNCKLGHAWKLRFNSPIYGAWYLAVVTDSSGECPDGTLILSRPIAARRLHEQWLQRVEEDREEQDYARAVKLLESR